MKRLIVFLLVLITMDLSGQQIVEAEYFFDVDPGFGLGTAITITPNQDVSDLSVSIDVTGITNGIHNLNVRAKDDSGSWSLTHKQIFLKSQLPSSSLIVEMEYYLDNDPGAGNGVPVSIASNSEIDNKVSAIITSGLSEGVHTLSIRAKDENGRWSHVESRSIFVTAPIALKNIVELEYYVGADPGVGNGVSISISAANDISNFSAIIPISDLGFGINNISIRSKDSNNHWSHSSTSSILKMGIPALPNIDELEYFFGADPGFGNGTFVSYTPSTDWSDISVLISVNDLPDGVHILNIRSRDANDVWSFTNSTIVQKTTIEEETDIVAMEYFFDEDPGLGFGTVINISPNTEINNMAANISVSGLSKGVHTLFLRSKNENGVWSLANTKTILITKPKTVYDIVHMEYFFDVDPGYGLGDSIFLTELPDIVDLNSMISTEGLSIGVHRLYVRSRGSNGKWSHDYFKTILHKTPDAEENIVKMEYYIGDDPGLGNGIDITVPSITAVPDIVDLQALIDVNMLDQGVQRLSIRSKNDLDVWSHTHVQPIYVNKNVNGNMVAAEYFIDTDPGYGNGIPFSFAPEIDKNNHIIPIDLSALNFGVYQLHVRYMSENNKWTQDEITPFYFKDGEVYEMVKGEYFIDEDPGLGSATSFTFPMGIDVPDLSILILTNGLESGEHDLYIRTMNANGEWSLTNVEFDIEIESALPLSILSFEVIKKDKEAILEWKVSEAINTSHFEIERTTDKEFTKIGRVASINESQEIEYDFIDSAPMEGWNYYRLKQVDLDGEFEYSAIRSVRFNTDRNIVVYPNPSINEIRIDGYIDANSSFLIYNSENKLVKNGALESNTSIDVSDLIPGAYFFILQNDSIKKSFLIIKI